jgi:hypothetical protein
MKTDLLRKVRVHLFGVTALTMIASVIDCASTPPQVLSIPGTCPIDPSDEPAAILKADLGLSGELEGKVKAALAASGNLKSLANKVEGDVTLACGNLARDLGAKDADVAPKEDGPGKKAEAACRAADQLLGQLKISAKVEGSLKANVVPPVCSASTSAVADCAARCDVSGKIDPAKMSAECKANCDAEVDAKLDCTPAGVTIEAGASANAEAFGKLKVALEKNLPAILKVTLGMKARLEGAVASVKASIEGVYAIVKNGGQSTLRVAGCFAQAFRAQAEASVSIDVSIEASTSASSSAGAV